MSHKDLNPVNRKNPKRVAIVISNPVASTTTGWPVGFWWSELSHPYFRFTELGYQAEIFSPEGGACAADARSDPEDASQWQAEDVTGADDPFVPVSNARYLAGRMPGSKLSILDAGHFAWEQVPGQYAAIIADWVARAETQAGSPVT